MAALEPGEDLFHPIKIDDGGAVGEESLRRTDVARKYLVEGVRNWKLEQAIRRYQQGQVSLERAAADAGFTLYEMMDELRRRDIALDQTTPAEARAEIRALLEDIAAAPN